MTGGLEGGYGSGGASPVPSDGSDDERATQSESDHSPAASLADDVSPFKSDHGDEITPHTKPFRAWGAAQERSGPSLWERFTGWVRGLFSRKEEVVPPDAGSFSWESLGEQSAEAAGYKPPVRSSFDDLDAPWSDPLPVEERRSSRPSAERPSVDDFQATWDGSYESDEEPVSAEIPAVRPPPTDADPLWDSPAVAQPSASAPLPFEETDLEEVWSPREEPQGAVVIPVEPPKKGFFARLFGRKTPRDADAIADQERAAASDWAIDIAEASSTESELEPADADFADDVAAATVPADSDFVAESTASPSMSPTSDEPSPSLPKPSINHSAEDAANLAALLGPITPVVEEVMPEVEEPFVEEPFVEEPFVDEPMAVIAEEAPVVDDSPDASLTVDPVLVREVLPEPDLSKKPGFFSSLLRRVSRSQFIPKPAVGPVSPVEALPPVDDLPPMEIAAAADVVEQVEVEVEEFEEIKEVVEVVEVVEVEEVVEDPYIEDAPEAQPAAAGGLDSTQPFPAFRDARDDFPETVAAITDSGRPTEQVDIPVFDESVKTDEFEVVTSVPGGEADTADTETAGFFGRMFGKKPEAAATGSGEEEAPVVPHTVAEGKVPFVLAKFRTFYNEIIRDKHQRSDVISGFATAIVSANAFDAADPEFAAQLLSKRLSEMLELQAAESNWTGGDAAKYYLDAQYAMVALADETFATIDWPGRAHWHKHMLEPRMYGTRGADIEFFKRIDKMLKDNPDPPKGERELARVYLLVIASGFRGKFRVPNVHRPLAEYRRRLYEFSHRVDPLELYARDRRIFPDAAGHTLASRAVGRFTSAQKWIAAVAFLAVLYLGVSHFAWARLSADLKDVMSRIENTDASAGRTP